MPMHKAVPGTKFQTTVIPQDADTELVPYMTSGLLPLNCLAAVYAAWLGSTVTQLQTTLSLQDC